MVFPEYDDLDATALADLVRRREVTPAELLDAALERADERNPPLNAIVHRFDDEARRRASGTLPGGPFSGVPFLIKDLLALYAGQPATASCRIFAGACAPFDSETVQRFKAAGLVTFGQTNTPELGIMPVTESRFRGPCRNPWSLDHTPGGSSGGSAAAVAARIVPVAHGNDAGGSIRIPSSACGLFGLKPSRGRVSLGPAYGDPLAGSVQDHVLSRTVRDSAAMLDLLAGNVAGDPVWAPPPRQAFAEEARTPPGRLRIAVTRESLFGSTTHPDCAAAVDEAAALLADLGHEVSEARPDFERDELVRAYLVISAAGLRSEIEHALAALGRRLDPSQLEPETWALAVAGRALTADTYAGAVAAVQRATRSVAALYRDHDVLMTPTLAHPPARIGAFALRWRDRVGLYAITHLRFRRMMDLLMDSLAGKAFEATGNTMLFNQTGQPAMSVPLHVAPSGLPIGVQLAGRYGDEGTLFRLAAQLEAARPWVHRKPALVAAAGREAAGSGRGEPGAGRAGTRIASSRAARSRID